MYIPQSKYMLKNNKLNHNNNNSLSTRHRSIT